MRIGVLGLGLIGKMHARNFAQTPGVSEVVLLGRDPGRLESARGEVAAALAPGAAPELSGALAPSGPTAPVTVGASLDDELPRLDGLVVATSTRTHPEFALKAARAGVPSLVEKPLDLDPDRLEALSAELEATGTEVMVAFHRRYDPAHQELRCRLAEGEAGTIRAVTGVGHDHYALRPEYVPDSGGLWLDMLIHDFDAIPWVTGQQVCSVWASGAVLDAPVHAEHGDVDSGVAVLVLESGAVATVSGLRRNGAGQDVRMEVFGSLNTLAAGIDARTPITSTEPDAPPPAPPYDVFIDRFERAFRAEADAFVKVVDGTGTNLTPPRAGIPAVRIALAAARSLSTGDRIELDGENNND
ncbi:Gfo/Idh/MocA family protein [Microbacterium halophytorum]|uniref:Gfo/Idh/MocA family protein n=1 Tax=Microbacterium halophytorum TaxID=2067568 RepID=UPI000CFBC00D|nr:Gfo/Idh/MocA family oxidoreductase [Microbacterium halophytorum]